MSRASIWTIARFPPLPAASRLGVFTLTCRLLFRAALCARRLVPEGLTDGQTQKDCHDEFDAG
jgi:hypothetical protein